MIEQTNIIAQHVRTWRMLNEGQQAQLSAIWDTLSGTPEDKARWLREPDGEGYTRLARIAMGEASAVHGEAVLALA